MARLLCSDLWAVRPAAPHFFLSLLFLSTVLILGTRTLTHIPPLEKNAKYHFRSLSSSLLCLSWHSPAPIASQPAANLPQEKFTRTRPKDVVIFVGGFFFFAMARRGRYTNISISRKWEQSCEFLVWEFSDSVHVLHCMLMAAPNQVLSMQGYQNGNPDMLAVNDLGNGSGWRQSKSNWALRTVIG